VVGVASLPVGEDHDARTQASQYGGDLEAIFLSILHVAVRKVEGFAVAYAEDFCGGFCLGSSLGSGAASARFAAREIEDAGAPAEGLLDQEGTAAGLLDVIAMRSDGKDVERTWEGGG
jgi:phosphoribosylformylglycinamidine (FGAM) synthase-like amidotransferase family enzyme